MPADPLPRFPVGVKMAVRMRPVPESAPREPLVTATSSHVNVLPGSSLKVKVIEAVSPAFSVPLLLVMLRFGGSVSIVMTGVVPAPPGLPAASA